MKPDTREPVETVLDRLAAKRNALELVAASERERSGSTVLSKKT